MIYLLDTNTCIQYLNGRGIGILKKLPTIAPADVAVCSVVKGEMFYGSMKSTNPAKTRGEQMAFLDQFQSLPFDDAAAAVYGRIRAELAAAGTPIGPNDMMIAAIAIANGLILVTHNTGEFERVHGLQIEDWESGS
ncbi:MAG: type II toxin-antitoxin system VapC family toxin [Chloroflexi bacterium]|nr:type II toxin-antitoxin system VapC family toxin [Chloroflexota bacterium]